MSCIVRESVEMALVRQRGISIKQLYASDPALCKTPLITPTTIRPGARVRLDPTRT
jgi:hypothetical protein